MEYGSASKSNVSTDLSRTNLRGIYQPSSRVVGFERKDKIAKRRECGCVTSDRIVHVQGGDVAVPHSVRLLGQDKEVMAVQMNRVWDRRRSDIILLDHPVLPL
jgi:hypothetical protein